MDYRNSKQEEKEELTERYELALERIREIKKENTVEEPYRDFFIRTADFIVNAADFLALVKEEKLKNLPMKELEEINHKLYEDILPENYDNSYGNPSCAVPLLQAGASG